jgi:putative heme-binding domain-containing protein
MAAGRGGFIGPDLTTLSQTHSAEQIKAAITKPAERESHTVMIAATTGNGQRYEGVLRNEDNFSLQLQSADGQFHFLSKADLKTITWNQGSIMPSDYESKLTEAGLNDIVSYLLSLANTSAPTHADGENDE